MESVSNIEIEMAIKAQVIILHKSDTTDTRKDTLDDPQFNVNYEEFLNMITAIIDVEIVDVIIIRPVKLIITRKLLSTCKNNKADVIFITGNIESIDRHAVNKAVEAVINHEALSEELENLIKDIETKLEEKTYCRTTCGIRNRTLIINLHEPLENNCFAAIADMLLNTLHVMRKSEHLNMSLLEATCSSDNNSLEQRKSNDSSESFEKSTSTCDSSLTENIEDNEDNRYMELFPAISLTNALLKVNELTIENMNDSNLESVKINNAYGRILCEDVRSNCNVPPFKTSKKHGYAVLVSDGKELRQLLNEENEFPPISLQRGTCVWVNSGAPVPNEATAVVQAKDAKRMESLDKDKVYIEIMIKPQHGQNINPIGYDIMKGKIILNKFTRIGPEEIGLLAASGCKEIEVVRQLPIGVLSIGDNLEEPGKPLQPGYVYDINRITLISLLKHNGFSSLDCGIVKNELMSIQMSIEEALEKVDILVTTGSVSDKDLLKRLLMKYFDAEIHFGNVNIKPGKSTTLATCKIDDKNKYFLCLSGNPSSAFIAAQMFLLPFVNKICCNVDSECAIIPVHVDCPFILHQRPRLAWTDLKWADKENVATASSKGNLFEDKLNNITGSNALLLLPDSEEKRKALSKGNKLLGFLVDYPGKFNRHLLSK